MQLALSPEETRLLVRNLAARVAYLDAELVHTDKRELQRALAQDVQAVRGLLERVEAIAASETERISDAI